MDEDRGTQTDENTRADSRGLASKLPLESHDRPAGDCDANDGPEGSVGRIEVVYVTFSAL